MITTIEKFLWTAIPLALAVTLVGSAAHAGEAKGAGKNTYLVIAPHTPEDCLAALDSFALRKKLETFEFGCMHGDHTGYARIQARGEADALSSVPERERQRARAVQLVKFTPEQLKAAHASKK